MLFDVVTISKYEKSKKHGTKYNDFGLNNILIVQFLKFEILKYEIVQYLFQH